ncbi:MAG TPA: Tm-1-like ATP-binding domain-containing protein [Planctomycetaceae bacterium]|nr:Tm-1-like ATP-binding domain-containing protein [Planctomycetaceae bacterium]
MLPRVYAVATMDTKGTEIVFVADRVRACGVEVVTVDVGTKESPTAVPDVSRQQVAASLPAENVLGHTDRGDAVTAMSRALVDYLKAEHAAGRLAGVIGVGGGGGTALITPAMRALPVGVPKLMVSAMVSGNVGPYVDCSDLTLMYSVVDVAGINSVSRRVLSNAAAAIAGMARNPLPPTNEKPTLAMTMFGVTTPCVEAVRKSLEARGYDCLVFHATGSGDRAMENLVRSGLIQGVLDVTTTAVADQVVGGVLPCGPHRFEAILDKQIPYVLSVGALDMANFGATETVPPQFAGRKLHVHNAHVTLMRTTPDENKQFARWIAGKLNRSTAPLSLLIPELGVSMLDAPGQPFHDPVADAALFEELEQALVQTDERRIKRLPLHINDPQFAAALVEEFLTLAHSGNGLRNGLTIRTPS